MKQARTVLSTYSADTFGVCSALYELGGMTVMHDASGCNSTYTTHDEPRWYDSESLVFISALTEMDAILGNDDKLKNDMLDAIHTLHPKFAAVAGTPIPMMNGCDLRAIAAEIEAEAGIPCFAFATNGMHSYLCGVSEALETIAERIPNADPKRRERTVNLLGATPLDFSLSGTVESVRDMLTAAGWDVIGCFAMGSGLADFSRAGEAAVNLVLSASGMKAAKRLQKRFGTPYVVGTPIGTAFSAHLLQILSQTAADGIDRMAFAEMQAAADCKTVLIGESVISRSIAAEIGLQCGFVPRVVHPLEQLSELEGICAAGDCCAESEEEMQAACAAAETVIADPLYRPILPQNCRLIRLPHEAFSGRMFRKEIPDLTKLNISAWFGGNQ